MLSAVHLTIRETVYAWATARGEYSGTGFDVPRTALTPATAMKHESFLYGNFAPKQETSTTGPRDFALLLSQGSLPNAFATDTRSISGVRDVYIDERV